MNFKKHHKGLAGLSSVEAQKLSCTVIATDTVWATLLNLKYAVIAIRTLMKVLVATVSPSGTP